MMKLIVFATIINLWLTSVYSQGPTVTINNGVVMGKSMFTAGTNTPFSAYMGIPYAKPPLGDLRFEPPLPADNWSGIFYANRSSSSCVQNNPATGSEDCLHINVFVPNTTTNCPSSPLNVMVFIHGGGFSFGDGSYETLNQDNLMEVGCMVSVTFTYRLGCFGYLSAGDLALPGNAGMKDQVLALQWVHDNIGYFGGNANNVTLVGQSAGAASVALHLETPNSGVLFHAAIIESGSSFCDWARDRSAPTEVVHTLASLLSLSGTTTSLIKQQLKQIPYDQLQTACTDTATLAYAVKTPRDGAVFSPVIEPVHPGAFKTLPSFDMWQTHSVNPGNIPIIIGATSFENNYEAQNLTATNIDLWTIVFRFILLKAQWDLPDLAPVSLNENDPVKRTEIGLSIRQKYNFPLVPTATPSIQQIEELNDDMFYRPVMKTAASYFLNNLNVYVYIFDYCGDALCLNQPRTAQAPSHAEELNYIFTNGVGMSARDKNMKNIMGTLWGNFVKYHNPTISGLPFTWTLTDANLRYLNINDNSAMVTGPWRKSYLVDFWDPLFATKGHPPFDTY